MLKPLRWEIIFREETPEDDCAVLRSQVETGRPTKAPPGAANKKLRQNTQARIGARTARKPGRENSQRDLQSK